jgi:polyisoprenoid-binding protein YceI
MTSTWQSALLRPFNIALLTVASALPLSSIQAAEYKIDTQGAHAFVQFKIKHLGYSWLWGRFNDFKGDFSFDETKPEATKVNVEINMTSLVRRPS